MHAKLTTLEVGHRPDGVGLRPLGGGRVGEIGVEVLDVFRSGDIGQAVHRAAAGAGTDTSLAGDSARRLTAEHSSERLPGSVPHQPGTLVAVTQGVVLPVYLPSWSCRQAGCYGEEA